MKLDLKTPFSVLFSSKASTGKAKAKHALVLSITDSAKLGTLAAVYDKKTGGAISRALKAGKFAGKAGQVLSLVGVDGVPADRIILVGLGKESKLDNIAYENAGGHLLTHLNANGVKTAEILFESGKKAKDGEAIARVAYGARLAIYHFDKYHTKRKDELKPSLDTLTFVTPAEKDAKKAYAELEQVAEGVEFARTVVTEPPNVIYPESLAEECKKLSQFGVKVEVLNRAQMEKLGMGALLGVAQGSVKEGRMVIMQWNGAAKSKKPIAFVGKGVTFDTGGISIKPSTGMEDMKYDMAGSAAVIGLMRALAGRKAKANVVGVVGLVENMPDGNAQRPSDVVTSMSGQTIEVLNTDAEGRLVLADALWYTQQRFKPEFMINLATLTGAITIALGDLYCGIFSNSDALCKKLEAAGNATGEKGWRFPLGDEYDKQINSDIADMKNIGDGRGAGSITAAQFLQRFVNDVPWAHLDIAGMAWTKKPLPTVPKGAVGFGVRLLNQLVKDHYEK